MLVVEATGAEIVRRCCAKPRRQSQIMQAQTMEQSGTSTILSSSSSLLVSPMRRAAGAGPNRKTQAGCRIIPPRSVGRCSARQSRSRGPRRAHHRRRSHGRVGGAAAVSCDGNDAVVQGKARLQGPAPANALAVNILILLQTAYDKLEGIGYRAGASFFEWFASIRITNNWLALTASTARQRTVYRDSASILRSSSSSARSSGLRCTARRSTICAPTTGSAPPGSTTSPVALNIPSHPHHSLMSACAGHVCAAGRLVQSAGAHWRVNHVAVADRAATACACRLHDTRPHSFPPARRVPVRNAAGGPGKRKRAC